MKKPKKPTAGEKIACWFYDDSNADPADLARRIDRAIASAVRKERERCINVVRANMHPNLWTNAEIIEEINRP